MDAAIPTAGTLARNPSGGLLPWLAATWRRIAAKVAVATATKEERELFHLMELAASRVGTPVLSAATVDDLDELFDDLVDSPDLALFNVLMTRLVKGIDHESPASLGAFASAAESVVGEAQSRALEEAAPLLDAWTNAQLAALELIDDDALDEPLPPLTDPSLPPDLAEAAVHGLQASMAMLAILRALITDVAIQPWLARALVLRLIAGVRGHLRLLASLPGIEVPVEVVPLTDRLDLVALRERHERARLASVRSLEAARSRVAP